MATDCLLAIVIPAYKSAFFRLALESIANQTDQRFQVYIGDDASPEPLADIVRDFSARLPIQYQGFETNLGRTSLVKHWDRCIRMCSEPWVWLFSDDDTMDAGCVEAFYRELKHTDAQHDLYRFNTLSVNSMKQTVQENIPHPQNESGSDFLLARVRERRLGTAQELIFLRAAYEAVGGFPDFPSAWRSDDGFTARLGVRKSIRTIPGPRVNFRMSGLNISTKKSAEVFNQKFKADCLFVEWATRFLVEHPPATEKLTKRELTGLMERFFFWAILWNSQLLNWRSLVAVDELAAAVWHRWRGYGLMKALMFNCYLAGAKAQIRIGTGFRRLTGMPASVSNG